MMAENLRKQMDTNTDLRRETESLRKTHAEQLRTQMDANAELRRETQELRRQRDVDQTNTEQRNDGAATRVAELEKEVCNVNTINEQLVADFETTQTERDELERELEKCKARNTELEWGAKRIVELQQQSRGGDGDGDGVPNLNSLFDGSAICADDAHPQKDAVIDALRRELAEVKTTSCDAEAEIRGRLERTETAAATARDKAETKLRKKAERAAELKGALEKERRTNESMRAEMDQLQSSMEKQTLARRADAEETQQEMMDCLAKTARQEREISALRMELEETGLRHRDATAKLQERVRSLEEEAPSQRAVQTQRDDVRVEELNNTIQQLKWRNSSLEGENRDLAERLANGEASSSGGGGVKSSKNDKWRNTALKEEVRTLRKRIQELETRATPAPPSSARRRKSPTSGDERSAASSRGDVSSTHTKYTF